MKYEQALDFFLSFPRFGKKGGTHKISRLLSLLGDPQDGLKFIHVAGTNGKGSVCSMLARVLTEAGYKTGLFISPYITDFRERVQIDCKLIDKEILADAAEQVSICVQKCDIGDDSFCSFEIITAAAFLCFKQAGCDIVVLETGVGGKNDCTNIIAPPLCSVITSIGLDHTEILGDTIQKIAREKCGIIKSGSAVVTASQSAEAMSEIEKAAKNKGCPLHRSDEIKLENISHSLTGIEFIYNSIPLTLSLLGTFQEENARVVLKTLEVLKDFPVSTDTLSRGLKSAVNPARFEVLSLDPPVIIDGAHNPAGLSSLAETVKKYLPGEKVIGLMAMLSDKDFSEGLKTINRVFDTLFITGVQNNSRSLSPEELCRAAGEDFSQIYSYPDPETALSEARSLARERNCPLVICGSLYLAAQIRNLIITD